MTSSPVSNGMPGAVSLACASAMDMAGQPGGGVKFGFVEDMSVSGAFDAVRNSGSPNLATAKPRRQVLRSARAASDAGISDARQLDRVKIDGALALETVQIDFRIRHAGGEIHAQGRNARTDSDQGIVPQLDARPHT